MLKIADFRDFALGNAFEKQSFQSALAVTVTAPAASVIPLAASLTNKSNMEADYASKHETYERSVLVTMPGSHASIRTETRYAPK